MKINDKCIECGADLPLWISEYVLLSVQVFDAINRFLNTDMGNRDQIRAVMDQVKEFEKQWLDKEENQKR